MNFKQYVAEKAALNSLREIFLDYFKNPPLYHVPSNDAEFEKMLSQAIEIYKLIKE
jgi:hypothetical protein